MTSDKKSKESQTMADLLAKYGSKSRGFTRGEKVEGRVLEITPRALILDIGGKSEGIVAEKAFLESRDFIRGLKVGDTVTGEVIVSETPDGYTVLSLRHAFHDYIWQKVEKYHQSGEEVQVEVKNANPSGLVVEVFGLGGFIPASQIGAKLNKNTQALVGKKITAKIIDVVRDLNRVVLSEREVSEKAMIEAEMKALTNLKAGEVFEGEITTVTDFGVFVRINAGAKKLTSLEGLVHISELSWDKVDRPSNLFAPGDKVKVVILEIRNHKLSLSIKKAQDDPWTKAAKKYQVEAKIKGKITRVTDFGVFVALESGIEGLIHITKIPPATRLKTGDEVNCTIEEVNPEEKRISLGLILTSKPVGYK